MSQYIYFRYCIRHNTSGCRFCGSAGSTLLQQSQLAGIASNDRSQDIGDMGGLRLRSGHILNRPLYTLTTTLGVKPSGHQLLALLDHCISSTVYTSVSNGIESHR